MTNENDSEASETFVEGQIGPPNQFDQLFVFYGEEEGVPPKWIKAICMNESSLGTHPRVVAGQVSEDGKSWGLMQLRLETARDYEDVEVADLNVPDTSIRIAAKHIARLMTVFEESEPRFLEWVVKAYNEGEGNAAKERAGTGGGYANEYWARFQRNLSKLG